MRESNNPAPAAEALCSINICIIKQLIYSQAFFPLLKLSWVSLLEVAVHGLDGIIFLNFLPPLLQILPQQHQKKVLWDASDPWTCDCLIDCMIVAVV